MSDLEQGQIEHEGGETPIVIRGLTNRFGSHAVHEDLDLTVRRGEILGVVGGSGTGKSVLMRSIIGLQPFSAGHIEVLGHDTAGLDEAAAKDLRRKWGVLFQDGALFSTLTVAENIQVPMREFFNLPPALMNEISGYKVAMVGLPIDAAPKYPSQLSGGMRKRAGLARALSLDPELLFLDEPSAGLDPLTTIQAVQAGAAHLEKSKGGMGILLFLNLRGVRESVMVLAPIVFGFLIIHVALMSVCGPLHKRMLA